ncbi:MAG: TIGR03905 family TSCPD domain-containing protein [Clostridium sp.]|uniref:TIGR03905 family TSCPD domain-containing protein n=1 Tax=Clostridium sp. TaxID=1506 RepID=UPI00290C7F1C|nr:TIGR03905 family TSCPD domain-containing protein [Clostridium sp.]MDU4938606.1 TIGR03905 family TSCPD domain-containing protein [Clostridium sp.]
MYSYKTKGTCSTEITFSIENDIIKGVNFLRGCEGNLQGISRLVEGMNVEDAINKLQGIDCRGKGTSCPDQLAKALKEWKENR